MKTNKFISILLTLVFLFGIFTPIMAEDNIKVLLNNTELSFDISPQLIDGRTLVPIRAIAEVFNKDVLWDNENRQVLITDKEDEKITVPEIILGGKYSKIYEIPHSDTFFAYKYDYDHTTQTSSSKLVKFDINGNKIWLKDLSEITNDSIRGAVVYPDGQFTAAFGPVIIKFDVDGNIKWKCDLKYSIADKLFITETDDIVAVGEWARDEKKRDNPNIDRGVTDIVVTKINKNGCITAQKVFGGSSFSHFLGGNYSPETGLVIMGWTQSFDGDFARTTKAPTMTDFIACIDINNLTVKWKFVPTYKENEKNDSVDISTSVVYNGFTYLVINNYEHGYGVKGTDRTVFLVKLDSQGNQIWKTYLFTNIWARSVSILRDDKIVVNGAIYPGSSLNAVNVSLVWLDQGGNVLLKNEASDDLSGIITPTDDGGFIVCTLRYVKILPTPEYFSSIWYDTETIATKFDKDNNIVWQKIYDNYIDSVVQDMVVPLSNGKIIVE